MDQLLSLKSCNGPAIQVSSRATNWRLSFKSCNGLAFKFQVVQWNGDSSFKLYNIQALQVQSLYKFDPDIFLIAVNNLTRGNNRSG